MYLIFTNNISANAIKYIIIIADKFEIFINFYFDNHNKKIATEELVKEYSKNDKFCITSL